jgi:hypothetical protein
LVIGKADYTLWDFLFWIADEPDRYASADESGDD